MNRPVLYQVGARTWTHRLSRGLGRAATLDDIPDAQIDRLAEQGFDWVWLLGAWQTGPESRRVSRSLPELRSAFARILPDLEEDDIAGSGFAVAGYTVHRDFGGDAALARLRRRLARRGMALMLDFVPNHAGLDHPWAREHPDYYVAGTAADAARAPDGCYRASPSGPPLAHGRDPNFPPWTDTLQLNYANPALQQAMLAELAGVADRCDGVRCDMAMLLLPEVFERTWGVRPEPFWPRAIARVRDRVPGFVFMAEVYWDLERVLQRQGFDFTYDKRLYDLLREGRAGPVRTHLGADTAEQSRMVRFLENHDEERAAAAFAEGMHEAAAVLTYLSPGMRLFHDGMLEGRRVRIPPHLRRGPGEPPDSRLAAFYDRLLAVLRRPAARSGAWRLLDPAPAWPGNPTHGDILVYGLQDRAGERLLACVNYAPHPSQCFVGLPFDPSGRDWRLADLMGAARHVRNGQDLAARGLYLDLAPWQAQVFALSAASAGAG